MTEEYGSINHDREDSQEEPTQEEEVLVPYTPIEGEYGEELPEVAYLRLSPTATRLEYDLFDYRAIRIDLRPLRRCPLLRSIDLSDHDFEDLDLSPLASCTQLRVLDLSRNRLTSIDLSLSLIHI